MNVESRESLKIAHSDSLPWSLNASDAVVKVYALEILIVEGVEMFRSTSFLEG